MATDPLVAVVVPRRDDGGRRDELWAWVQARYDEDHPDWALVEGHHLDGPFNRCAAINAGVAQVPGADVLVLADSDSYVAPDQLRTAVEVARSTGQMTFAHSEFRYLDKAMSDRILAGWNGPWESGVAFTLPLTQSSCVVVPMELWRRFGGADEGFVGWGGEDVALGLALSAFGGGLQRVQGPVWHLWHPGATDGDQEAWTGRLALYGEAADDPEAMAALLERIRPNPPIA